MSRTSRGFVGIFYALNPGHRQFLTALTVCLCLLVILPTQGLCQSLGTISGSIYDIIDGHPIGTAKIWLVNTEYTAVSGSDGQFSILDIPVGSYIISAEAEGYERLSPREITIAAGADMTLALHLDRRVFYLGEIEVTSTGSDIQKRNVAVITRQDIQKQGNNSVPEALNNIEGVFVQQAGAAGSESRISIRGSDPKHVLVLVDGQKVNPAGTGVADLSSIPIDMVEKIEVYKGGESARFGSEAVAGVIVITTVSVAGNIPEVSLSRHLSDWKGQRTELFAKNILPVNKLSYRMSYSRFSLIGDYPFNYSISRPGVTRIYPGPRQNAGVEQSSGHGSFIYQFDSSTTASLSGQYYESTNGLPGPVSNKDLTAWKHDKRILINTELTNEASPIWNQKVSIRFSRFEQYFNNMDHESKAYQFESRYLNDIASAELYTNIILFKGNDLSGAVSAERNILYHDDIMRDTMSMGRMVRDNIGVYLHDRQSFQFSNRHFIDAATLGTSLRFDNTDTKRDGTSSPDEIRPNDNWSHKITASVVKGTDTKLIVRGSYGKSYRLPSVNALFYVGDVRSKGNPDLRPETSEHSDAGIELQLTSPFEISVGVTYFHNVVKDLIVWQPGSPGQTWKPVNLEAARITGHEDFIELAFKDFLKLSYTNTVVVPRNRSRGGNYNNDLTFRPRYVTLWKADLQYKYLYCRYVYRSVGKRYAKPANEKPYDPYQFSEITVGARYSIANIDAHVSYKLSNPENEDYVLIGQYPMPQREWNVRVALSYHPGKTKSSQK